MRRNGWLIILAAIAGVPISALSIPNLRQAVCGATMIANAPNVAADLVRLITVDNPIFAPLVVIFLVYKIATSR